MSGLEKHYTTDEIAEAFSVTPYTVGRWVKRGLAKPTRLGSHDNAPMRWTQADYDQLRTALAPPEIAPPRRRRRRAA
jgi:hypothetical protein